MRLLLAVVAACASVAAAQQWPLTCTSGPQYSAWNQTRCPSTATCCTSGFSMSGFGCCPMPNAVCCPNGYTCCPGGTVCTPVSGTTWSEVYNCTQPSGTVVQEAASVCKPGPALPYSSTLKNVLVIGDSLSIGYTPFLASNLSDIALVQHAPWDTHDGGAEETTYGLRCLQYFLASPSGMSISPDVIIFNWGMHDGPMSNDTVPGQNAPPTNYAAELNLLAQQLVSFAKARGSRLLFALTTAYLCNTTSNGCVQNLNNQAAGIMAKYGIPTANNYQAIIDACGAPPVQSCFGVAGCFCPHCPTAGYQYLTQKVLAPTVRAMLTSSTGLGDLAYLQLN